MIRVIVMVLGLVTLGTWSGYSWAQEKAEKKDTPPQPAKPAEKTLSDKEKKELEEAEKLNRQAIQFFRQGQAEKALPLALQALEMRKRLLGENHPAYATSLNNLGRIYQVIGQPAKAEPLYILALEIRKRVLGDNHPDYATTLNNLGLLYQEMGQPAKAEPLHKRDLEISKRVLGESHPHYAISLNSLGLLYQKMGQPGKAEPLFQKALEINKRVLGENHPDYANSLNNLGLLYQEMGQPAKAEPLYKQALEIRKRVLGDNHPDYATSLNNLGLLYQAMGQPVKAEPPYKQALEINKRVLGDNHPHYATSLNNLGLLYQEMGQPGKAEPLFQKALEIRKRVLGDNHPAYATSLNNLGILYQDMGQPAKAEPLYIQALEINKRVLGDNHPTYATSLNNLGLVYKNMGQPAKAEPLHKQALEIRKGVLGDNHPDYARSLSNLGMLYQEMGQPAKAEPLCQQALEINKRVLGDNHPAYANSLSNLGMLYQDMGQPAKAEPLCLQAQTIILKHLAITADGQAENAQQKYLRSKRDYLDNFLSASLAAGQPSFGELLAWKGLLFLRQQRQRAFAAGDSEARKIQGELQDTSRQLGRLYNATPKPEQAKTYQEQLAALTRRLEELESELARRSAPFVQAKARAGQTPEALSSLVPPKAVLVDLLEYLHYLPADPGKTKARWERRYLAWVVRPGKPVTQVPLGSAKEINNLVAQWRLRIPQRIAPTQGDKDPALALRDKVLLPLLPHLEGVETLLISPDSQLGMLPFAALPGRDRDKYLIEEMEVVVVPFAQSLPDLMGDWESSRGDSLLVLGEVDYGADPGKATSEGALAANRGGRSAEFKPLEQTRPEVAAVSDSFEQRYPDGKARQLRKKEATEQALRDAAPKARWLHLATHGFFAPPKEEESKAKEGRGGFFQEMDFSSSQRQVAEELPGLLSGLVLAGANQPLALDKDDGILTASEVQELNLTGVEQAVLSACETGLGQSAGGEGILGLQRAFQMAGCRTVVASLWQVPDKATKELMTRYYENLWEKKLPKGQALREAQLYLLREGKDLRGLEVEKPAEPAVKSRGTPPVYWAAWVLSGAWR